MAEYLFSQSEQQLSSGFRELLSVDKAFDYYSEYFASKKGCIIIWITDSACLCSFLEKGSRILEIQKIVIKIKLKEFEYGIKLRPKWVSRETPLLRLADLGSKLDQCSDQYGVSSADFLKIQSFMKKSFTIDGFASSVSRRTYKYISPCPQYDSMDTDFFSHRMLGDQVYYLHPPPKVLIRLVNKIVCYKNVRGCIVMPLWRSHSFWNYVIKANKFAWFVKDFMIFSPFYESFSPKTMFQGFKKFKTLVIHFDTSSKNELIFPDF